MSESQFAPGRVKLDQHVGPCVGDWYEMKDGGRRRFGRDLGESLQLAADPSGRCFFLDADGNMRLTTVLCCVRSFKNRCWANRWNNDGAVRLIMCSRQTAVSSKKGDGRESCFSTTESSFLAEGLFRGRFCPSAITRADPSGTISDSPSVRSADQERQALLV